jgi:hypothetical protein
LSEPRSAVVCSFVVIPEGDLLLSFVVIPAGSAVVVAVTVQEADIQKTCQAPKSSKPAPILQIRVAY